MDRNRPNLSLSNMIAFMAALLIGSDFHPDRRRDRRRSRSPLRLSERYQATTSSSFSGFNQSFSRSSGDTRQHERVRLCWFCKSADHLKRNCPAKQRLDQEMREKRAAQRTLVQIPTTSNSNFSNAPGTSLVTAQQLQPSGATLGSSARNSTLQYIRECTYCFSTDHVIVNCEQRLRDRLETLERFKAQLPPRRPGVSTSSEGSDVVFIEDLDDNMRSPPLPPMIRDTESISSSSLPSLISVTNEGPATTNSPPPRRYSPRRPSMHGYHYSLLIVSLICFLAPASSSQPNLRLSSGVHTETIAKIFYEGTSNIIYEVPIPDWDIQFSDQYTCSTDDCIFLHHIAALNLDSLKLLNISIPSLYSVTNRYPRGLGLNFIGSIENWCCGIATDAEIDSLEMKNHDLASVVSNLKAQLATDHDAAVRANQIVNTYSEQIKNTINNYFHDNDISLEITKNRTSILEEELSNYENSLAFTTKTLHHAALTATWSHAISSCNSKRIPHTMVNTSTLYADLLLLEADLQKHGQRLSIPARQLNTYYSIPTTRCYYNRTHLSVRVKIPIRSSSGTYELLAVSALPFSYNGSLCSINALGTYVILKDKSTVIPLHGHDVQRCVDPATPLCFVQRYPKPTIDQDCMAALLLNNRPLRDLKTLCPFRCSNVDLSTPVILQFSSNHFGVIMDTGNITTQCPEGTQEHHLRHHFGLYDLTIPCNCAASVTNYKSKITPSWPCANVSLQLAVTHTLPLSWASKLETSVYSPHNLYHSAEAVINHDWTKEIPVINISSPAMVPFSLPTHVHVSSYSTYIVIFVIFIIIGVITYIYLQLGGATSAITLLTSTLGTLRGSSRVQRPRRRQQPEQPMMELQPVNTQ